MSDIVHALRNGRGLTEGPARDAWLHGTMQEAADEIERLRSRLADIEAQNRVMWDVANDREARLAEKERWDEARVKVIHELHERANEAEERLAEAEALLRTAVANCDLTGYEGAAAWADRRAAFLAADSASDDYRKPCADCGKLTDVWYDGTHLCWKCRA